mmetsp:Transcript_22170/g.53218  ORF Transcript_22170/g.53218 Transcript_22170/m.53218 type:complete len:283 (-) Transcript_22170:413-1261(-)
MSLCTQAQAREAQSAIISMKNELANAEEQASERIAVVEHQKIMAERGKKSWQSKFEREKELRKNAEAELDEADARCTAALRAQDEERHTEQLRAQDELLRSNNEQTLRKAHEAAKRTIQAERQAVRNAKALQQERNRARDERELRERMEDRARLQEQHLTEQLRARDEHTRSNNQKLLHMQQLLESQVQQLNQQLQRANTLKEVQVAQSLTEELALAKAKLAKANSMNASLRRNQDAKKISQLQANFSGIRARECTKGCKARASGTKASPTASTCSGLATRP